MEQAIITNILMALATAAAAVIGWLLIDLRTGIKESFKEQKEEIKKAQDDLANFKTIVYRDFVPRDDHIRAIQSLDCKVDRIGTEVNRISENLNKFIGGNQSRAST